MSIFPVRVTEWYDDKKSAFYKEREMLKIIFKTEKCHVCKRPMKNHWKTGYAIHAITFGYGEAWCTLRCLRGNRD